MNKRSKRTADAAHDAAYDDGSADDGPNKQMKRCYTILFSHKTTPFYPFIPKTYVKIIITGTISGAQLGNI